jgi:hypothetical protein
MSLLDQETSQDLAIKLATIRRRTYGLARRVADLTRFAEAGMIADDQEHCLLTPTAIRAEIQFQLERIAEELTRI